MSLVLVSPVRVSATEPDDESVKQSREFLERGDYRSALNQLRSLANHEDPEAERLLGQMYEDGHGVPRSFRQAVTWYLRAAHHGSMDAQLQMTTLYATGYDGVRKNHLAAARWDSAGRNHRDLCGVDVMTFAAQAISTRAFADELALAEAGNADSQTSVGLDYWLRTTGTVDGDNAYYAEAAKWFRRAAEQGDANAAFDLGHLYGTAKAVGTDAAEALKWVKIAANRGNLMAQCDVAASYQRGLGTPQDFREAARIYRQVAETRSPMEREVVREAQYRLGAMLLAGEADGSNPSEGIFWLIKAAEAGLSKAQFGLGEHYLSGDGVRKDLVSAYKWVALAARYPQSPAIHRTASAKLSSIAALMTAQQIHAAEIAARSWEPH